jgi:hypothetical protein
MSLKETELNCCPVVSAICSLCGIYLLLEHTIHQLPLYSLYMSDFGAQTPEMRQHTTRMFCSFR